jgi:hypothetical protein
VTAPTVVRCACCQTQRPAAETYERVPRSGERFCTDTAGCRRRMAGIGDPVTDVDVAAAAPPPVVPGARCAICGTVDPPGGVYAGAAYMCLDRAGCTERSVEFQFLTAHREDFPEVANTTVTGMMHAARDAGAPSVPTALPLEDAAPEQAERDSIWRRTPSRRRGADEGVTERMAARVHGKA